MLIQRKEERKVGRKEIKEKTGRKETFTNKLSLVK